MQNIFHSTFILVTTELQTSAKKRTWFSIYSNSNVHSARIKETKTSFCFDALFIRRFVDSFYFSLLYTYKRLKCKQNS
jgi:hypothetical protein